MKQLFTTRNIVIALFVVALFLVPLYAVWAKNNFILSLFTRCVILAIAATSLNLIMGYGGMVSFGHAAYLRIGGYCVGILAFEGSPSHAMAARDRDVGSGLAHHRRSVAAHARGLFHHDHARLRADDLLRRRGAQPLRRR